MGTELNLTEDQRRRIEDAKSAEEKVAIIMEAADAGMELSDEQLEGVSGGNVLYVPSTHAEIDRECDIAIVMTPCDTPEQVEYTMQYSPTMPMPDDPRAYIQMAQEKGIWTPWKKD